MECMGSTHGPKQEARSCGHPRACGRRPGVWEKWATGTKPNFVPPENEWITPSRVVTGNTMGSTTNVGQNEELRVRYFYSKINTESRNNLYTRMINTRYSEKGKFDLDSRGSHHVRHKLSFITTSTHSHTRVDWERVQHGTRDTLLLVFASILVVR